MQTFELGKFLNAIYSKYREQASEKGIELNMAEDLAAPVLLSANIEKMERLMDTVILNAIDNSNASAVEFSIRQLVCSTNEILLEFLLEENSRGPKRMAYYRAMIHAKGLIEELQGKSELALDPDFNTTLKFILKCTWQGLEQKDQPILQTLAHKKLLIVEDNEMNQRAIMLLLQRQKLDFDVADNGRIAIDMIAQHHDYDAILMDINMLFMDGLQTTRYIRKVMDLQIPIIGMSTGNIEENTARCLESGMNGYIAKPFDGVQLMEEIGRAVNSYVMAVPHA